MCERKFVADEEGIKYWTNNYNKSFSFEKNWNWNIVQIWMEQKLLQQQINALLLLLARDSEHGVSNKLNLE